MNTHDRLALNGTWQLHDTSLDTMLPDALPAPDATTWLPVPVPGAVQQALLAAGRIPEPLVGMNSEACAWIETRAWWFRRAARRPNVSAEGRRACEPYPPALCWLLSFDSCSQPS
jgi:hypothetical protein